LVLKLHEDIQFSFIKVRGEDDSADTVAAEGTVKELEQLLRKEVIHLHRPAPLIRLLLSGKGLYISRGKICTQT
jgi:hypothetical protein